MAHRRRTFNFICTRSTKRASWRCLFTKIKIKTIAAHRRNVLYSGSEVSDLIFLLGKAKVCTLSIFIAVRSIEYTTSSTIQMLWISNSCRVKSCNGHTSTCHVQMRFQSPTWSIVSMISHQDKRPLHKSLYTIKCLQRPNQWLSKATTIYNPKSRSNTSTGSETEEHCTFIE